MTEYDELIAHQADLMGMLHGEVARVNQKLVIIIVIMLISLAMSFLPYMLMPMYNLVNVIR
ncbi:hypothetical protein JW859_10955 [bacterium]|nr:hypothetical protein [bacterium]